MSINNTILKVNSFINNEEVTANEYYEVKDPGQFSKVVAHVAQNTKEDANKAVSAAHAAFKDWGKTDVKERIRLIQEASEHVENDFPQLTQYLVRENGTVLKEVESDFPRGIRFIKHTLNIAEAFLKDEIIEDGDSWLSIQKKPIGVTVIIIPWNSPINLIMGQLGPALVTGNTVVVKPSPFAPVALSLSLQKMAEKLPKGVINVVHGENEVGSTLTEHALVRKVSFTGGTETGKAVMRSSASNIKRISLELGGNDPAIILDDVDPIEIMPRLVQGIFSRAGQVCYAIKRVYVPESIYEPFYDAMCELVNEFKVGHGLDPRSTLGPVNNLRQYTYIKELVEQAEQNHAVVRQLGQKVDPESWDQGYYILPTIVKDVAHSDPIVTNEQFGPVIPLIKYKTEDQAITWANELEYGLASSVWSSNRDRAVKMAEQIEAGATFINSHSRESSGANMPFGGVKQSGIGRMRTDIGLAECIEYHSIRYLKKYFS